VPIEVERCVTDRESGETSMERYRLTADEGIRASTLEGLAKLKPVFDDGCITAGNAASCPTARPRVC
jgi:acetyl-CoA acetyltransferase